MPLEILFSEGNDIIQLAVQRLRERVAELKHRTAEYVVNL